MSPSWLHQLQMRILDSVLARVAESDAVEAQLEHTPLVVVVQVDSASTSVEVGANGATVWVW
jgi:hypothetical protein